MISEFPEAPTLLDVNQVPTGPNIPTPELAMLLGYLNDQRNHVLGILEGLDDDMLRRPMLPSGWSCLGLLQHLALDVERFWFRCVVAGDQIAIDSLDEISSAWDVDPETSAESVFAVYRQEIAAANEIVSASQLDAAPTWWPEGLFGDWRIQDVHQVILHTMTETSCHAGHLDAVRELIDARQWLVLT